MYLSYEEYISYGGTLSTCEYMSISVDVDIIIDYYTFNRLQDDTNISDKVKQCAFKLTNLYCTFNRYQEMVTNLTNPVVNSQSNDGVSVSYGGYVGNTSPTDIKQLQNKLDADIFDTIKKYLIHEKNQKGESLLYRGVVHGK